MLIFTAFFRAVLIALLAFVLAIFSQGLLYQQSRGLYSRVIYLSWGRGHGGGGPLRLSLLAVEHVGNTPQAIASIPRAGLDSLLHIYF